MAITIILGNTSSVQVTYRDAADALQDPTSIYVSILDANNAEIIHDNPTRLSLGLYRYNWIPGSLGSFILRFVAQFTSEESIIPIEIMVVSSPIQIQSSTTLGQDREFVFIYNLDPLYVDPEELQQLFPDADPVEILELIYSFSVEANDVNESLGTEINIPTPLMREFVFASSACALTRIYDPGANIDSSEISLGDLSVRYQRSIKDMVTRSNAETWCELAGVIRNELYRFTKQSGIRAIVKGANVIQAMPDRNVKTQEWVSLTNNPFWIK